MEMYQLSPINVEIIQLKDTVHTWSIKFSELNNRGGLFSYGTFSAKAFKWDDTLNLSIGKVKIKKRFSEVGENGKPHVVEWNTTSLAADEIRNSLSVKSLSARTTIISLSILSSNPTRSADILNLLSYEFAEQDVELKREISVNTLRFIDDRLRVVSDDLRKLDSSKIGMHGDFRFLDAGSELFYYQNKYGQTESRLDEAFIDTAVIRLIEDYVRDDRNRFKKIFSPLGIGDPSLSATIGKYNDLVSERDKAAYENPNDNIIMSSIENNLENMRANVLISLGNVKRAYGLKIQIFNERNNEYNAKMGEIPDKNALELELKKQKEINAAIIEGIKSRVPAKAIDPTKQFSQGLKNLDVQEKIAGAGFVQLEGSSDWIDKRNGQILKQADAMKEASKRAKNLQTSFKGMNVLSFLFTGQAIEQAFRRLATSGITSFMAVAGATNAAAKSMAMLGIGVEFVKITIG